MLTKKIECPSCSVKLRIAETLSEGRTLKCPKCGSGFPVPAGNGERVPEEATAKRKKKPSSSQGMDWEKEVEKRPIHQTRRKKRKKAAGSSTLVLSLVIVGVVLVIGAGITLVLVRRASAARNSMAADNNSTPAAPNAPRLPAGTGSTVAASTAGTSSAAAGQSTGDSDQFATGRSVFQENCTRCHNIGDAAGRRGRGPDLTRVAADPTHTVDWLMDHIRDPKSHKPDSRMPRFAGRIDDDDLRALATYLASLK